jgi:hypothetical protein
MAPGHSRSHLCGAEPVSGGVIKGGAYGAFGPGRASGVLGGLRLVRRLARQRPAHSSARPPMPPTTQAMMMPVRVDRPPLTGALASAPAAGRRYAQS